MDVKEIVTILLEIGFEEKTSYYQFAQEYPTQEQPHGCNLWVGFEKYDDKFWVGFNAHNYGDQVDIKDITSKEDFLKHLDFIVINSKNAWIYEHRHYFHWASAADEQRKRYFDKRMEMESKPCQDILDHIKEHGTVHFPTAIEVEVEGKKIGDMSWEELANIVLKTQEKRK